MTPWSVFFRVAYRVIRLLDPVLRWGWRRRLPWFRRFVDVGVAGRRTGRTRWTLVTLLTVGDNTYVGHPNGAAAWTRNVADAESVELRFADGSRRLTRPVQLFAGPELESVIRATWTQQPFPANVAYAAARRHVRRVGVYFRLNPAEESGG